MLQIKKKAKIIKLYYGFHFLLRNKNWRKKLNVKQAKNTSIILRAPKHFNIGKQKITNLNYKTVFLEKNLYLNCSTTILFNHSNFLYKKLEKKLEKSVCLVNKSIKVVVETKFLIKWLEF